MVGQESKFHVIFAKKGERNIKLLVFNSGGWFHVIFAENVCFERRSVQSDASLKIQKWARFWIIKKS